MQIKGKQRKKPSIGATDGSTRRLQFGSTPTVFAYLIFFNFIISLYSEIPISFSVSIFR